MINKDNLISFNKWSDDTLVQKREEGVTFKDIGKILGRSIGECSRRYKIITKERAKKIAKLKAYKLIYNAKYNKAKKAEQIELFLLDLRDPIWHVMKGREFEDEPEYIDPDVMRADILAEQRHTTPYGF